ncbi:MAG: FMN-binding protein [Treponema sp.]|jgi:electron transport complex protein RnfG|nr:FMN-binding protein [Treponema sp.]
MKRWDVIKLGLVMMVYAAAACVGLAFVYAGTEKIIEEREAADLRAAITELFPASDGFDDVSGNIMSGAKDVSFEKVYAIRRDGKIIGAALQSVTGSYGGPIKVLVGVNTEGVISRIRVLEHTDTPGLGANAAKSSYYVDKKRKITFFGQFENKQLGDGFEPGKDVVAITAATITSAAVSRAVKAAGEAALVWIEANGGTK